MEPRNAAQPSSTPASGLPLTMPWELWCELTPPHQKVYRAAQHILDSFPESGRLTLVDALEHSSLPPEEAALAVQLLGNRNLVTVETSGSGPELKLVALPDEHVKIVGPDGQTRWIFVARPVAPPAVDPSRLN